eukprot:TRINITY_DN65726_c1_g2_i1.p1 TRINITY_DN65726_c1_g2~~TRINITY_DN65726_c1_g2_i1.p1  ORF type:complete len:531 (+),score=12.99 TRINITY_DN65726_c1_g2_i1:154-1593(+)
MSRPMGNPLASSLEGLASQAIAEGQHVVETVHHSGQEVGREIVTIVTIDQIPAGVYSAETKFDARTLEKLSTNAKAKFLQRSPEFGEPPVKGHVHLATQDLERPGCCTRCVSSCLQGYGTWLANGLAGFAYLDIRLKAAICVAIVSFWTIAAMVATWFLTLHYKWGYGVSVAIMWVLFPTIILVIYIRFIVRNLVKFNERVLENRWVPAPRFVLAYYTLFGCACGYFLARTAGHLHSIDEVLKAQTIQLNCPSTGSYTATDYQNGYEFYLNGVSIDPLQTLPFEHSTNTTSWCVDCIGGIKPTSCAPTNVSMWLTFRLCSHDFETAKEVDGIDIGQVLGLVGGQDAAICDGVRRGVFTTLDLPPFPTGSSLTLTQHSADRRFYKTMTNKQHEAYELYVANNHTNIYLNYFQRNQPEKTTKAKQTVADTGIAWWREEHRIWTAVLWVQCGVYPTVWLLSPLLLAFMQIFCRIHIIGTNFV